MFDWRIHFLQSFAYFSCSTFYHQICCSYVHRTVHMRCFVSEVVLFTFIKLCRILRTFHCFQFKIENISKTFHQNSPQFRVNGERLPVSVCYWIIKLWNGMRNFSDWMRILCVMHYVILRCFVEIKSIEWQMEMYVSTLNLEWLVECVELNWTSFSTHSHPFKEKHSYLALASNVCSVWRWYGVFTFNQDRLFAIPFISIEKCLYRFMFCLFVIICDINCLWNHKIRAWHPIIKTPFNIETCCDCECISACHRSKEMCNNSCSAMKNFFF